MSPKLINESEEKNHDKHKCSLKNQRKELLEGIVEYVLDDLLQDPVVRILMADKCYAYYKSMNDDGDTFEESIKARIKEVDKQLDNFLNAIGQGIFNESTQERMKALEHQKSMLNDELIAEQNRKKMVLTEEQILKYLDTFLSKTSKEELLDYLVDKIYVSNDKLTITLHYTDDARELPYKETIEMINEKAKVFECDVELTPEQEKLLHTMIASAAYPGFGDESEDPDSF